MARVARALQPPPILQGPLIFGDRDQIEALREYEDKVGSVDDPVVEWTVSVEVSSYSKVKVQARTKAEAEAIVEDMDLFDLIDSPDIEVVARKSVP